MMFGPMIWVHDFCARLLEAMKGLDYSAAQSLARSTEIYDLHCNNSSRCWAYMYIATVLPV